MPSVPSSLPPSLASFAPSLSSRCLRAAAPVLGALAVVASPIAGCAGGGGDGAPSSSSAATGGSLQPFPLASLAEVLAAGFCANAFECCSESNKAELLAYLELPADASRATCEGAFASRFAGLEARLSDAVAAGRASYDAAAALTCASGLRSCGEVEPSTYEACDGLVVGKVATGAGCASSVECASPDDFCTADGGSAPTGLCKSRQSKGQPCGGGLVCKTGLECSVVGACVEPPPKQADGAPCASSLECGLESYCATDRCAPKLGEGQPCGATEACAKGYCDPAMGACVPPKAQGEPCVFSVEVCETTCDPQTMTCSLDAFACVGDFSRF